MVVQFSKEFVKQFKKIVGKNLIILNKLSKTLPTDGKHIALIKNIELKEKKLNSFRFYFVQKGNSNVKIMTDEEIKNYLLKFINLSKKNNQQDVIDKLKEELKNNNFKL